eukprot:4712622-Pyramimonas_sp.AAC.1
MPPLRPRRKSRDAAVARLGASTAIPLQFTLAALVGATGSQVRAAPRAHPFWSPRSDPPPP